ncbi:hypothetical protein S40288_08105 [Stachybotrys chartarum IBT 40288]|nr:hypothetical protein S40288_08105 [Stachybotrys chartarum IBT 40288]
MARRRTRAKQPVVVEEEETARETTPEQEPEPEPEPEVEEETGQRSEAEEEHDEQHPEEPVEGQGLVKRSLQFNEELSWRPAKPISSATLLTRLEKLAEELGQFDQEATDLDSLRDVAAKLAHRNLVQHKDRGVRAYTACCLVEMLRLFAPDAPFTDDQLKMMFMLFIKDILPALHDPTNPYDSQHKYVLMSLTEVKSILLLGDIHGADDLLLRLFNSSFDGVSSSAKSTSEELVAKDVEVYLTEMLVLLIDESPGSVPVSVIDAIIGQFMRAVPPGGGRSKEHKGDQTTLLLKTEPPAYVMAKKICNLCADKMARYVSQYFSEAILSASTFATKSNGYRQGDEDEEDDGAAGPSEADLKNLRQAHLLIRELWRAAPTILQNVVPQLDAELSADNVYLRQIATETFGDMISGIGAAGPPPPPVLDPAAYPPLHLLDDVRASPNGANVLTNPSSPQSFAQTHPAAFRNFVTRKNDKAGVIRAAWVTAAGSILSTSAGGVGLSREEETELITGLRDRFHDPEEKVRLAAVKVIELFEFRDIVQKLGVLGGVDKEGSIFHSLADRCRDKKPAVRVEAMILLSKLWAVGSGELAEGQDAVASCLGGAPSRIVNAFYINDSDMNVLLDRVMFECLVPLKFPSVRGKGPKGQQSKSTISQADQDRIRAERILLMLKSFDTPAQKAFFAMQARQPQFAKAVQIFLDTCEAYNGGVMDTNEEKVKSSLKKTMQWFSTFFPDDVKVINDLQKFAKLNDRRCYQLIRYAIESDSDFKTVRRAINELITKIQGSTIPGSLDTLIPLLYRSSPLMFNRSHLTAIMDCSKSDKGGYASAAHQILNDISQRNPDIFKAHSEELRKEIIEQAPSETRANDPSVVDMLKAYSSYAKRYPNDINIDRSFTQTLLSYALYGAPAKAAKYAINILLVKNDDKGKVTATNLLQKITEDLQYESPRLLNKLSAISQLQRLVPTVVADVDEAIHDLTIKQILRQVRTEATSEDPTWVDDPNVNEELQAKFLSLKILVNQAIASEEEDDAEERVKPILKLLKTFVINEGEFCKVKDTPQHHKKRLRLLAGQLMLKLSTVKKYDDQLDHPTFHKLAELVQDSELQVRRRFMEKLQNYLTRGRLRARFYTILFLVAFEPVTDLKARIETWIRSRAHYYAENKKQVLEAVIGRLIPLLAHHPDYSPEIDDLVDFANYFLFYLNAVATEDNVSLIYKYAERVKQTRDGITPEASDNLYVLSDLAQAVIRQFQEKRGWSFQAFPGKVGLPTGLYSALPSSEVAQQIAKKQYIPEELEDRLDEVIRAMDRKKKRKSVHDFGEPPAKKTRTQSAAGSREKNESKPRAKSGKAVKMRPPPRPKKAGASPADNAERRRSGRAHKTPTYKERDDEDDEAEMMDGVAEWDYGEDDESNEESGGEDESDAEHQSGAGSEEDEPVEKANSRSTAKGRAKQPVSPAVKASLLSRGNRSSRLAQARAKPARDSSDMEVDDDDDE